jgi:hypothetical protein
MSQHTFITYTPGLKQIADRIMDRAFINSVVEINSSTISANELLKMATASTTEFFYVISSNTDMIFKDFNFSFKPPEWDSEYVHIWDNDLSVRLYNKFNVLASPEMYDDTQIYAGSVKLKVFSQKIYTRPAIDIVFISFDEFDADCNYATLLARFPKALRVNGVKGIFNAHLEAAKLASSEMFYVVDADAEILPTFDFSYYPSVYDIDTVHVWHSKNPINDLEYGYGGVKLFPRQRVLEYTGSGVDFTTSVSKHFKVMQEVSNITKFNTDPFSSWRSGFRECAKLASKLIIGQDNAESEHRLNVWCTTGHNREFGEFSIMGANEGRSFGTAHKDRPELLGSINDYRWLEQKFQS